MFLIGLDLKGQVRYTSEEDNEPLSIVRRHSALLTLTNKIIILSLSFKTWRRSCHRLEYIFHKNYLSFIINSWHLKPFDHSSLLTDLFMFRRTLLQVKLIFVHSRSETWTVRLTLYLFKFWNFQNLNFLFEYLNIIKHLKSKRNKTTPSLFLLFIRTYRSLDYWDPV